MKRKFGVFIGVAVLGVILALCLSSCGNSRVSVNGTYYYYKNGDYVKTNWVKLDDGEWTDSDGTSGTYDYSDGEITVYVDFFGSKQILGKGTVKDGVLIIDTGLEKSTYCKEGKTPADSSGGKPSDPNDPSSPSVEQVTVTYNANGGKFSDGGETFAQSANKGALLTAPDSPSRNGYTFAGWAKSKNGSDMWRFDEDKADSAVTLYAKWTEKSAVILSVDGASIDGNGIFMLVDRGTESVSLSSKVVCSSDSIWRLYYDKLGQTEIPTKIAAGISGELANGNNIFYVVVTSQNGAQTSLYELTVHRSHAVNVNFYDGATVLKSEVAYTGDTYSVTYVPEIEGYTFNGWRNASGSNVSSVPVWESVRLYADKTAKEYVVNFNVNGGNELSSAEMTVVYDNGYRFAAPTRTGYTFLGWYSGSEQVTDGSGYLSAWKYPQNKTLTAKWEANIYTLTVQSNNTSGGTVSGGGDYAYDTTVRLTATTKSGYTFIGWYDSSDKKVSSSLQYSVKVGFNATYTAKWISCPVSVRASDTSAGTVSSLPSTTVAGDKYTVSASGNKLGYNWLGWYDGSRLVTAQSSFTFTMPSVGSISYVATWELDEAMTNFTFTSTATTCVITGVKNKDIETVVVPAYVTSIGDSAFSGCSSLTSITISESVTSIGQSAFESRDSLTSITIPESVMSIGIYAFANCSSLTIYCEAASKPSGWDSKWNNSNCPVVWNCKNNDKDSSGYVYTVVDSVRYLLKDGIAEVIRQASNLSGDITIPNNISYKGTTYSVMSIGDRAFYDCDSLTSITISEGVTSIGDSAFQFCSSLTSITISEGVTSIGDSAFYYCRSLTSITIPNSITSIGNSAFYNCSSLQYNEYDNGLYLGNKTKPYVVLVKAKNIKISTCNIHDNTKVIYNSAFYNCSSLTSIAIPESVTSIGSGAFEGCKIETATIPTIAISSIPQEALKTVIITRGRSIGDRAFYDCDSLTSITIPESVTSIGRQAFSSCSSLTSITIPESVTSIKQEAFFYCSSLTSITIPESVTSIEQYAFGYCSGLTSVTIPESVTSIGYSAFGACSKLASVTFENANGWQADSTAIAADELADSVTAARYLTSTYRSRTWTRS